MEAVTQQLLQPVIQFMIIGRRIQRHSKLAQESGIVNALMRFAIRWDKTGAVDGKNYILPQQIYVVDDLIIGALEEGRIDRNDRQQALTGKACRKADGILQSLGCLQAVARHGAGSEARRAWRKRGGLGRA